MRSSLSLRIACCPAFRRSPSRARDREAPASREQRNRPPHSPKKKGRTTYTPENPNQAVPPRRIPTNCAVPPSFSSLPSVQFLIANAPNSPTLPTLPLSKTQKPRQKAAFAHFAHIFLSAFQFSSPTQKPQSQKSQKSHFPHKTLGQITFPTSFWPPFFPPHRALVHVCSPLFTIKKSFRNFPTVTRANADLFNAGRSISGRYAVHPSGHSSGHPPFNPRSIPVHDAFKCRTTPAIRRLQSTPRSSLCSLCSLCPLCQVFMPHSYPALPSFRDTPFTSCFAQAPKNVEFRPASGILPI